MWPSNSGRHPGQHLNTTKAWTTTKLHKCQASGRLRLKRVPLIIPGNCPPAPPVPRAVLGSLRLHIRPWHSCPRALLLRGRSEGLGHTSVGSSGPPPGPWRLTHPILLHFSWADIPISPCSYGQLIALTCWWVLQQTRNFYLWPSRVGEYLWSANRCRRLWLKAQ